MQSFLDWLASDISILGQNVQYWTLFIVGIFVTWIIGAFWIVKL